MIIKLLIMDKKQTNNPQMNKSEKYLSLIKKIQKWILGKVKKANSLGIVLGISGGIDSATLALICYKTLGLKTHFYYLKTKSDIENERDIKKLNIILNNTIETIDLTDEFNMFANKFSLDENWIKANAKSRFFMNVLYTKAQQNNSLVLGTDNFNEYYLGYFTKWGDGACDLLPFANILKSDVYEMAKVIGVPIEIIKKRPSANLLNNQYDEDELGFTYEQFEEYILDKYKTEETVAKKIKFLNKKTDHKRKLIPKGPKVN